MQIDAQTVFGYPVMENLNTKQETSKLIDKLPEHSTIYVRQTVEVGLADSKAGNLISVQQVRKNFRLPE